MALISDNHSLSDHTFVVNIVSQAQYMSQSSIELYINFHHTPKPWFRLSKHAVSLMLHTLFQSHAVQWRDTSLKYQR